MRFLHKWIGLFLGIQLFAWMVSGFVMAWFEHETVEGHHLRDHAAHHEGPLGVIADGVDFAVDIPGDEKIHEVFATSLLHKAAVFVRTDTGTRSYWADTGESFTIDEAMARKIAETDFAGDAQIVSVTGIMAPTMETRESTGPGWRVDFGNPENSSLYLSAETGQVWERRNDTWRVFDFFWMLHIMDYGKRKDFNNTLVILSAWAVLWLAMSGFIMLVENLRKGDFKLSRAMRRRGKVTSTIVKDSNGKTVVALDSTGDRTLFEALAKKDILLPSSCGGGGSCGLCRVQVAPAPGASPADRREFAPAELEAGYRLACQHRDFAGRTVSLPHGLLEARDVALEVVSRKFVTPLICELRLRSVSGRAIEFRPGDYLQVTIPPYEATVDSMDYPDALKAKIAAQTDNGIVGTPEFLHRSYSIANYPGELGTDLLLNVKIALPEPGSDQRVGAGSAWIASLARGRVIQARGPFGDFSLKDTRAEKIFIGGGAGMAPLRSMLFDLLNNGCREPVSFWYGARDKLDVYYQEQFEDMALCHENFQWQVALSHPAQGSDWTGHRGLIDEVVLERKLKGHANPAACEFYLCGPPPMLDACLRMLQALGVPDSQIAFDDFGN